MRNILRAIFVALGMLASSAVQACEFCNDIDDGSEYCRSQMCTLCASTQTDVCCNEYRRLYGCEGAGRPSTQSSPAPAPNRQPAYNLSVEQQNDNTVDEIADLLYDSIDEDEAEMARYAHDKSKISKSVWRDIKAAPKDIRNTRAVIMELMTKQSAKGRLKSKKLIRIYDISITQYQCFIRSIKDVTYQKVVGNCKLEIENYHDAVRNLR